MIILGIDPGLATTGYGILTQVDGQISASDYGTIRTSPRAPRGERLRAIHRRVGELVATARPFAAAVEQLYFKRNVTSALAVGEARGVVLLALAEHGVPVLEFSPPEVKATLTGFGGADKEQMTRVVRMLLGLPDMPDDAADALAVALAGLFAERARRVVP
jgi:crossover junction endodeoxyribonuclease RuvC